MLKYVSKFALDILPSVVATIIGAYIVNHYIVTKPGADAPVAAAVSSVDPKNDPKNDPKTDTKTEAKAAPEAAKVDAKVDPKIDPKSDTKSAEKPADKPTEARRPLASREKTVAKAVPVPVPVQPSVSVAVPVVAAPATVPPVETATAPEEHRDANDLARAAIERLRGSNDGTPRAQEAARTPDAPRASAPAAAAPPVRPLPPPIMVSTPATETFDSTTGSSQMKPPYTADPRRPTPPADIPYARPPLDLRAEAAEPVAREHTSVAQDVLSAAKSVFHSVLPK
jgi:hypothetical protein